MRTQLSILSLLLGLIFLLSNFTADRTSSFVMMVVNEAPELPDVPFDYESVTFPDHLLANSIMEDTLEIGYDSGGVDTTSFNGITDEKATLGRVLFYDEKLSALENISCGTCHDQSLSFTENKDFSEGISSLTKRNSMHLNDLAWTNNGGFSWDMEITNLHEMIVLPLTDENEIGANMIEIADKLANTSYYPSLFEDAFGSNHIDEERIVDALAQFINSMTTFESRFDKGVENNFVEFTSAELRGKEIFSFHCTGCHVQGSELGFFGFPPDIEVNPLEFFPFIFNNGLPHDEDDAGAGEWEESLSDLFKIPTLRNIELTAPYMHDGRFSSLEEVVEHYSEGFESNEWDAGFIPLGGFGFSDREKDDLITFLRTLTDNTFITEVKWSDPFENAVINSTKNTGFENIILKPNPMSERAVIEFDNTDANMVSVNILSSDGKLIKHDRTTGSAYYLYKEDFGQGMYYVELIMDDKKSVQKLIVK